MTLEKKGGEKGGGGGSSYILPKNDHQNDKTLGWALWRLGFNVSTVVGSKVTMTVPGIKTTGENNSATKENRTQRQNSPPPHLL